MNEELKIQAWVDNRFGIPNTFNMQLLEDFLRDFSPAISAEARKQERERIKVEIRCSQCGCAVIGYDGKLGYITRSFVQCPECIEQETYPQALKEGSKKADNE